MDRRLPERDQSALQILNGSHLTEDALEVYSLGRLSSEEDIAVWRSTFLSVAIARRGSKRWTDLWRLLSPGPMQ